MKSIVLSSVVTALLMFSGCSKDPAVAEDTKAQEVSTPVAQEVQPVATETVSPENSVVDTTDTQTQGLSISEIESKLPTVYFDFDKYEIKPAMQEKIDAAAEMGTTVAKDLKVKLEGNCDEWGSDEYNFALGLKRADAVKKTLVADGVEASRISMVSYGKSNPVCTEHTKECWAKNRRVDFKLLP